MSSIAASNGDHQRLHSIRRKPGEIEKGAPRIGNQDLAHSGNGFHSPLDDEKPRTVCDRIGYELVSIQLGASEGEEHAPVSDLPRIRVERREGVAHKGAADLTAARGSKDLEEG